MQHWPPTQRAPNEQEFPQVPQLYALEVKSVQIPLQLV